MSINGSREKALRCKSILEAYLDGKIVEYYNTSFEEWRHATCPIWDFQSYDYRVKPEPLCVWVNVYRDADGDEYLGRSHSTKDGAYVDRSTNTGSWKRTIQLTENTNSE